MADGATPRAVSIADEVGAMLRAHGARRIGIGIRPDGKLLVCFTHDGLSQLWLVRRGARLSNLARDMQRELGPMVHTRRL